MSRPNRQPESSDDGEGQGCICMEGRLHINIYRTDSHAFSDLERLTKPSCRGDTRQHEFKAHHIKFEYRMCLGCVKKANAKNILLIFKHITYEQKSISFFNPFNYFT